jgi:hypothetical protein
MARNVHLANALGNYAINSGASNDYCKGLIVGLVSAIMAANGGSFDQALATAMENLPTDGSCRELSPDNMPESWLG